MIIAVYVFTYVYLSQDRPTFRPTFRTRWTLFRTSWTQYNTKSWTKRTSWTHSRIQLKQALGKTITRWWSYYTIPVAVWMVRSNIAPRFPHHKTTRRAWYISWCVWHQGYRQVGCSTERSLKSAGMLAEPIRVKQLHRSHDQDSDSFWTPNCCLDFWSNKALGIHSVTSKGKVTYIIVF